MPPHLQEACQPARLPGLLPDLHDAMRRGATLLTPTLRAARSCLQQYDRKQQREGAVAWHPPTVLAWNAWVGALWQETLVRGIDNRVLLNSLQERALWKHVISAETQPTPADLRLCQSATRLLGAYDVDSRYLRHAAEHTGINAQIFAAWYRRFEERCSAAGCLPAAFAEIEVSEHIRKRKLLPATEYVLYGFDSMTPAQEYLLAAVRSAGAHIRQIPACTPRQAPPRIVRCTDAHDEARTCAAWAREQLLSDPAATLAIVVPDLDNTRPELERELRAAIAPEYTDVTWAGQQPRYELSSGPALNRLRLIADALRFLRWCTGDLPVEDAGTLLRSPHLSLATSPERGAELDAFVLPKAKALRAELSMRSAACILRKHDERAGERLDAIASAANVMQRRSATYADCTGRVRELLHMANWPGPDPLSSEEFQAIDRWNEALDRLATLDFFGSKPTFSEAIAELAVISNEMLFAPKNAGAPVQVIALNEAAGSTASALWFLHADENTLSTPRSQHPFLPVALQRDLGMPGTSTARDEQTARLGLQHLAESAGQAIFSYAEVTGESSQRLSPLLEQLAAEWGATSVEAPFPAPPARPPLLETEEDSTPLPPLPPGTVHGGVAVITAQAQCPFRAFADHRLFASAPETLEAGYSYADRGDHVHTVLSAFWNEVHDHAALLEAANSYGPDGVSRRDALLRRLIGEVYTPSTDAWEAAYLEVQRERLFRLLAAWLDLEAKRPPFTVLEMEKKIPSAMLGPLHLELRVDRIDILTGGESEAKLLIDYKTGPAEPRDWFGERPDQPQLPVYAIAAGLQQVEALAFGKVNARDDYRCLKGRESTGNPFGLKRLKHTMQVQLSEWGNGLADLATAFAEGDTSVDPKEYPQTCEYCAQRMLCRVEASKPPEVDDDPTADDAEALEWQ